MERKIIKKTVFTKYFGNKQPRWKDVKKLFDIQDEDLVYLDFEEGEWLFIVEREEIENDEEYELRLNQNKRWVEEQKEKRYKRYLELKEEFKDK
jgi:hypothetical protein